MKKTNNQTAVFSLILLVLSFLSSCSSIPLNTALQENINRYRADSLEVGDKALKESIAELQHAIADLYRSLSGKEKSLKSQEMRKNVEMTLDSLVDLEKGMLKNVSLCDWLKKVSDEDFRADISKLELQDQKTLFQQLDKYHFKKIIAQLNLKKDKALIDNLKAKSGITSTSIRRIKNNWGPKSTQRLKDKLDKETANLIIPKLQPDAIMNWKTFLSGDSGKKILAKTDLYKEIKKVEEAKKLLKQLDKMQAAEMISSSQFTTVKEIIQKELDYTYKPEEKKTSWIDQVKKALGLDPALESIAPEPKLKKYSQWHRATNLARSLHFTAQDLYAYPDPRTGLVEMKNILATLKALALPVEDEIKPDSILDSISKQILDIKLALDMDPPVVQYYLRGKVRLILENGAPELRKLTYRGTLVTTRQGLQELRLDRRTKMVQPNLAALRDHDIPAKELVLVTHPRKQESSQLFFTFLPDPNHGNIFKLEEVVAQNEHHELSDQVYRIQPRGRVGNPYLKVRWARLRKSKRVQNRSVNSEKDSYIDRVLKDAKMVVARHIRAVEEMVKDLLERERAIGDEEAEVKQSSTAINNQRNDLASESNKTREDSSWVEGFETLKEKINALQGSLKNFVKWQREFESIRATLDHLEQDIEYLKRLQEKAK